MADTSASLLVFLAKAYPFFPVSNICTRPDYIAPFAKTVHMCDNPCGYHLLTLYIQHGSKRGNKIPYKFLSYPLLSAEPDVNPAMNGA